MDNKLAIYTVNKYTANKDTAKSSLAYNNKFSKRKLIINNHLS